MRPEMKRQRMFQKNPRLHPRTCSVTASVCDFRQNCIRRAIFETQVRLITRDIWQKTESWPLGQPRQTRSNCCQALSATALNSGGRASVEAWSRESMGYGSPTKLLCLTPCSSARIRSSDAKLSPTFSEQALTTCS